MQQTTSIRVRRGGSHLMALALAVTAGGCVGGGEEAVGTAQEPLTALTYQQAPEEVVSRVLRFSSERAGGAVAPETVSARVIDGKDGLARLVAEYGARKFDERLPGGVQLVSAKRVLESSGARAVLVQTRLGLALGVPRPTNISTSVWRMDSVDRPLVFFDLSQDNDCQAMCFTYYGRDETADQCACHMYAYCCDVSSQNGGCSACSSGSGSCGRFEPTALCENRLAGESCEYATLSRVPVGTDLVKLIFDQCLPG